MINVITLFSGYDSQCLALNRLGIPYDLAAWCEIDRHATPAAGGNNNGGDNGGDDGMS